MLSKYKKIIIWIIILLFCTIYKIYTIHQDINIPLEIKAVKICIYDIDSTTFSTMQQCFYNDEFGENIKLYSDIMDFMMPSNNPFDYRTIIIYFDRNNLSKRFNKTDISYMSNLTNSETKLMISWKNYKSMLNKICLSQSIEFCQPIVAITMYVGNMTEQEIIAYLHNISARLSYKSTTYNSLLKKLTKEQSVPFNCIDCEILWE